MTAALLILPGVAAGAQTGDQALVRVARSASGLLKGDVYVDGRLQLKGASFKTVSDRLKVMASSSISSPVAVGGIGEKLELLDISDAATAVSAAGFVQQRRSTG